MLNDGKGYLLPFSNAYWVIPGRLMAGEFPLVGDSEMSSERISRLIDAGIRQIIDLTEPAEITRTGAAGSIEYLAVLGSVAQLKGVDVSYQSFGVRDYKAPSRVVMGQILDAIDSALDLNRPVYVHCWAGIGRTGTVVGCYLARHGHASGIELLDMIQQMRRHTDYTLIGSPQSRDQIDMVLSWVEGE